MQESLRNARTLRRAAALTALLLLPFAQASAATTPKPLTQAQLLHRLVLSKVPLHTQLVVEINRLGQVVRVKSGTDCKNLTFNAWTYGNALQMWIRRPDGTAEVGLYRVDYNYTPTGAKIVRRVALIKAGGDWGNQRGAANEMIDEAKAQYQAWQKQQSAKHQLPSLKSILKATPKPPQRA